MGKAEQLDFLEEFDPKKEEEAAKQAVPPSTDRSKFKFAVMRQAVGGEGPTQEEAEKQKEERRLNEKYAAQAKFANRRYS